MSEKGEKKRHHHHRGPRESSVPVLHKEDVAFVAFVGLIVCALFFAYLGLSVWAQLEAPRVDKKLTKAQTAALLSKWEPFSFSTYNDGQLGASLVALALVCASAAGRWKRDQNKALVASAVMFGMYAILNGLSLFTLVALGAAGLCGLGAIVLVTDKPDKVDLVEQSQGVAARILFVVDAAVLVYAEVLRLQSPDVAVSEIESAIPLHPSVNPPQHRATRLALAVAFLLVAVGSDVHAYRGLLKIGAWLSFAALCPLTGVYTGSNKLVFLVLTAALLLAHIGVHCTFPFRVPFVQAWRRWRSDMNRVVRGAGDGGD